MFRSDVCVFAANMLKLIFIYNISKELQLQHLQDFLICLQHIGHIAIEPVLKMTITLAIKMVSQDQWSL